MTKFQYIKIDMQLSDVYYINCLDCKTPTFIYNHAGKTDSWLFTGFFSKRSDVADLIAWLSDREDIVKKQELINLVTKMFI